MYRLMTVLKLIILYNCITFQIINTIIIQITSTINTSAAAKGGVAANLRITATAHQQIQFPFWV
jgi:hypothetical protein